MYGLVKFVARKMVVACIKNPANASETVWLRYEHWRTLVSAARRAFLSASNLRRAFVGMRRYTFSFQSRVKTDSLTGY
jgi:hypothetical protein